MTLAVASQDLPKAKELIRKFRREFLRLLQENKEFDSVYQLSVGFFPLTRKGDNV